MFESAALGRSYPAKEYAALENDLRMKLFKAQGTCIEHKLPVLITIAGVDGSGRGAVANMLSEWMDAKTIRNHVFWMQTDEEPALKHGSFGTNCLPEAKSGSSWVVGMVAPSGVFVAEISARGSSMRRWNAGGGLSIRWRHPGLSSSSSGFISVRRSRRPV